MAAGVTVENESTGSGLVGWFGSFFRKGIVAILLIITTSVGVYQALGSFLTTLNDESVRSENRDTSPINSDGSLAIPHLVYDLKDGFRTNLADKKRFIMVKFFLAYGTTEPQFRGFYQNMVASEIMSREIEIRDVINTTLSSKTATELESFQGRIELKKELVRVINSILLNGRVEDVYYGYLVIL